MKEYHYGAQCSYSPSLMESFSSTNFWCTRAPTTLKIPIKTYPVIRYSIIHFKDIWIVMVGINPWPVSPPCVYILPINPQLLFYDGQDIHFDDRDLNILQRHHIQYFILKPGDYINYQTNDKNTNMNLNNIYCYAIMNCMRNHGTLKFILPHMNNILVETWVAFKLSSVTITHKYSKNTHILTLTPPEKCTKSSS